MKQQRSGLISNRLIFWLAIAMIAYAIFDATKQRDVRQKSHKTTTEQSQKTSIQERPVARSQPKSTPEHIPPVAEKAVSINKNPAPSQALPLLPAETSGSFLERMVVKYVAPTIQKSVQGQIDTRLNQLQREKMHLESVPNAPRMELKSFDKTRGQGIAVKEGKVVTFDITLWYLGGLEIMPKRTVTITQGLGQIYMGVEQGLENMQTGGIRTLIIPSHVLSTKTDNVLGSVAFYPEQGILAEVEVKAIK